MKLDDIELKSLRVFVTFCESLNMSKAALALKLTQPAISHHLALLEKQLETQLVHREVRPMVLTKAGEILYKCGVTHLAQIKTTLQLISSNGKGIIARLKLGIAEFFSEIALPLIAKNLSQSVLNLQLETNKSSVLIEKLISRELDMVISGEDLHDYPYLKQKIVYKTPLIGIYHNKLKKIPNHVNILATLIEKKVDYIEYLPSVSLGRTMKHYLQTLNYKIYGKITTDSLKSVYTLVSLIPAWGVTFPILFNTLSTMEKSAITCFNLPEPQVLNTLYLFYRQDEYESLAERIVDILQNNSLC